MAQTYLSKESAALMDINARYVVEECHFLTPNERNTILTMREREDQTKKLLKILSNKGIDGLAILIDALNKDYAYPWIAKKLDVYLEKEQFISTVLSNGSVPFPPNKLINRSYLNKQIREALLSVINTPTKRGWIVLHGMMGIGKSVLAAEALRDEELLKHFSSGVWWLAIGRTADDGAVLVKLQSLYDRMKPSENRKFRQSSSRTTISIEIVTNHLCNLIAQKEFRNSLIVVDDIMNEKYVRALDIGCPILATTLDQSIFNNVSGKKLIIPVPSKLTLEESKQLLANWVTSDVQSLPATVDNIVAKCRGFPMELVMVGSYMSKFGNDSRRWSKCFHTQDPRLANRRRNSGAHQDLYEAIKLCIEGLEDEEKEYFIDMALFVEDTCIPNKVLEILWDKSDIDVEDIMNNFELKSLIKSQKDIETGSQSYSIHDLHLEFLKDECCSDSKNLHRKLLGQYEKLCREDAKVNYCNLPKDGYIQYFLGYHFYKAEYFHLFPEVFLDLSFVIEKLKVTGPGDLLHDFSIYKEYFVTKEKERLDFVNFIKGFSDLLTKEDLDVFQLALKQPHNSCVYEKAKEILAKGPRKFHFDWCNNLHGQVGPLLSTSRHSGAIRHATFSPVHNIVASSAEDPVVKVWCTETQDEIHVFESHKDVINCSAFTSDGLNLITASSDTTLKVWAININPMECTVPRRRSIFSMPSPLIDKASSPHDASILTFTSHYGKVLWCCISSDDKLVLSSDEDGYLLLWKKDGGETLSATQAHSGPVFRCCFSPKDVLMAATCSYTEVKIWDTLVGEMLYSLTRDDSSIVTCHFNMDATQICFAAGSSIWKWAFRSKKEAENITRLNSKYSIIFSTMSRDRKYLAILTNENTIIIWLLELKKMIANFKGPNSTACLGFSGDGTRLLSASSSGSIQVWDLKQTSLIHLSQQPDVLFHPKLLIASPNNCNGVQVFEGPEGKLTFTTAQEDDVIKSCSLSPNGKLLLYVTFDGLFKVFNLETTELLFSRRLLEEHFNHCKFLLDNHRFIISSDNGTLRIWNLDGSYISCVGHTSSILQFKLFKNDANILSCSEDGTLRVWDVMTGKLMLTCDGHRKETITSCDETGEGSLLVSASVDQTARIWKWSTEMIESQLNIDSCFQVLNSQFIIRCCKFSPNGRCLALGNEKVQIDVWGLNESNTHFEIVMSLEGHDNWIRDIQFSSNSCELVSASDSIKWWNCQSGELVQTFPVQSPLHYVFASEDFKQFVTIDEAGILYILKSL